jgi:hypothetical protein
MNKGVVYKVKWYVARDFTEVVENFRAKRFLEFIISGLLIGNSEYSNILMISCFPKKIIDSFLPSRMIDNDKNIILSVFTDVNSHEYGIEISSPPDMKYDLVTLEKNYEDIVRETGKNKVEMEVETDFNKYVIGTTTKEESDAKIKDMEKQEPRVITKVMTEEVIIQEKKKKNKREKNRRKRERRKERRDKIYIEEKQHREEQPEPIKKRIISMEIMSKPEPKTGYLERAKKKPPTKYRRKSQKKVKSIDSKKRPKNKGRFFKELTPDEL